LSILHAEGSGEGIRFENQPNWKVAQQAFRSLQIGGIETLRELPEYRIQKCPAAPGRPSWQIVQTYRAECCQSRPQALNSAYLITPSDSQLKGPNEMTVLLCAASVVMASFFVAEGPETTSWVKGRFHTTGMS
jgi:hypothetical protein